MLDRFKDFVKRLELPEDNDIVYRVIDDERNAVEVTEAQYARWRLLHNVASMAVVGEDTVDNVMVRTTFSIMPENRGYKPFGSSAYALPFFEPLSKYSQRYDTWQEAEQGHRATMERIRGDFATARAVDQKAAALAGTAGAVRLAVTAGVPSLFQVHVHSEDEVTVHTPLRRLNGSSVDVSVAVAGDGFYLSAHIGTDARTATERSESLGVSVENGLVTCTVQTEDNLPRGILRVAQAAASLSA